MAEHIMFTAAIKFIVEPVTVIGFVAFLLLLGFLKKRFIK